jgi:hypothetical protein
VDFACISSEHYGGQAKADSGRLQRVECNVRTKASKKTKRVEIEEANYRAVNGIWKLMIQHVCD